MRPLFASSMGGIVVVAGLLAWTPAGAAGNQDIVLHTPGEAVTVTVQGNNLKSPDLQLYRSSSAVRGRAFGKVVNLELTEDRVSGLVGGQPTRLNVDRESDGGLRVEGMLGGVPSNFKVTPKEISGQIGNCSYTMHSTGERFEGSRACRKRLENPVFLELPPSFTQGGDAEKVATLGLVLGAR